MHKQFAYTRDQILDNTRVDKPANWKNIFFKNKATQKQKNEEKKENKNKRNKATQVEVAKMIGTLSDIMCGNAQK